MASSNSSLADLREGDMLDYELRTWTVTTYRQYPYAGWPAEAWTLDCDDDTLWLEREDNRFLLYAPADTAEVAVDGDSFPEWAGMEADPPNTVSYEGQAYTLAEADVRPDVSEWEEGRDEINFLTFSVRDRWWGGLLGGIAEYLDIHPLLARLLFVGGLVATMAAVEYLTLLSGVSCCLLVLAPVIYIVAYNVVGDDPPPEKIERYWVYRSGDDRVVLEKREVGKKSKDGWLIPEYGWMAYAGRKVEPYEFDNILPASER